MPLRGRRGASQYVPQTMHNRAAALLVVRDTVLESRRFQAQPVLCRGRSGVPRTSELDDVDDAQAACATVAESYVEGL